MKKTIVAMAASALLFTGCSSKKVTSAKFLITSFERSPQSANNGNMEPSQMWELGSMQAHCEAGWSGLSPQSCDTWASDQGKELPIPAHYKVCRVRSTNVAINNDGLSAFLVRKRPDGSQQDVDVHVAACGSGNAADRKGSSADATWHVDVIRDPGENPACDYPTRGGVGAPVIIC
jgi:hypothetical protein